MSLLRRIKADQSGLLHLNQCSGLVFGAFILWRCWRLQESRTIRSLCTCS